MKTTKILFLFIFGIFLINAVSAINVYGTWIPYSTDPNAQIEFGDSVQFEAGFNPGMVPPNNLNIILYKSGNPIYPFLSLSTNQNYYFNTFTINQSIYQTSGNFEIVISGWDNAGQSMSETLTLTVNPAPQPPEPEPNNPPEIDFIPDAEINESDSYNYQVIATDADNDTLIYSLIQKPSWLSISSSGLIMGTAPNVSEDTDYSVTVKVSDGEDFDTQNYILTVKDVPEPEPPEPPQDTTPPTINITNPQNTTYTSHRTQLSYTVSDDVNLSHCWYSLNGGQNVTTECAQIITSIQSVNGINIWTVYANDTSGNIGSASVTFIIDLPEDSDGDDNGSAYLYQDVDEIKYFEQFTKPTTILYPKEIPEPEKETNWFILIIIIGIIALIIVIALILISRLKY